MCNAEPISSLPPLALYIHWPFCRKKCPYCDFNSHVRDDVAYARWQQALLTELRTLRERLTPHRLVSIFFGGGTPSLMPPAIAEALIADALTHWPHEAVEITLEANPTSVEAQKFRDFKAAGINRVSLGVQSLRDEQLHFLGREHNAHEALQAVELAAATFDRYSFDMIYALPDQSATDWESELREALPYTRGHMSLYQLTIEPGTAFHHAYHVKQAFALPVDDNAATLYEITQSIMRDAGMPAYEVSNHAAPGQECRHNLAYWHAEAYLGIGPGAHGRVDSHDAQRYATAAIKSPERWLEQVETASHGLEENLPLTTTERTEEQLMMGLRLRDGIDLRQLCEPIMDTASMTKMIAEGALVKKDHQLIATDRGLLVLNYVLGQLLS